MKTEKARSIKGASNKPSSDLCEYCGKKREVKKLKFRFQTEMFFKLRCECVIERQKVQEKENQVRKMMQMLHDREFESGKYAQMTLSSWQNDNLVRVNIMKLVVNYINTVNFNNRNWLYLYGDYGLGKTHIGVALTRQITLDRQWEPALFRWSEHCSLLQQSWDDANSKVNWNFTREARILFLDDIDKTVGTPWTLKKLFDAIDYRCTFNLPTIIAANHSIPELMNFWSKSREAEKLSRAIISRIMGQVIKVVHFEGQDYRLYGEKNE